MSIERRAKSRFALITVRIGFFPFVVFFPLRCLAEVVEGLSDILCLFKGKRVQWLIALLENVLAQTRDFGPLDLADVDVKTPDASVRVRVLMR
jgi:hypothetical protein